MIDISCASFSRAGAYLCVSNMTRAVWGAAIDEGVYIRTSRGVNSGYGELIKLELSPERLTAYQCEPGCLRFGDIVIAFDGADTLRLKGDAPLDVSFPAGAFDEFLRHGRDIVYINAPSCNCKLYINCLRGEALYDDPGLEACGFAKRARFSGDWEIAITEFAWVRKPPVITRTIDICVREARTDFENYVRRMPMLAPEYREAGALAAYVNWSSQVDADGLRQRRIMLMSKQWMNRIWTWDCAFNAVELCAYDAEAAWNNFVSPFRKQHESGMLLDAENDRSIIDAYTKPPIHGWALGRLRSAGVADREKLMWISGRQHLKLHK